MIKCKNKNIYTHGPLQLLTTEVVYTFSYIAALFATAANIPYEEAVDRLTEIVKRNGKKVLEDENYNDVKRAAEAAKSKIVNFDKTRQEVKNER